MKKKFFTTLVFSLGLNLLIKPLWVFGIDRVVQNLIGTEGYGNYFSLFNLTFILNILLDVGITNYNNRNISRNPGQLSKQFSQLVSIRILLAFGYIIACLAGSFLIPMGQGDYNILMFLMLNQFLLSFILFARSNIAGLQLFKTDTVISVVDRLLMILICGYLLLSEEKRDMFRLEWFIYAQTAAYSITFLISTGIVVAKAGLFKPFYGIREFPAIMRKVLPYALLIFLMSSYSRIDSVFLRSFLDNGNDQAGIYAQSFRIFELLTNYGLLFAALLLPMFARMLKQNEKVGELVKLSYLMLTIPCLALVVAIAFYRGEIMHLLYDSVDKTSPDILLLLLVAFVFYSTNYIFGALLTANGSLKQLNLMALAGLAINVILNILLIQKYQALGTALACMVTQVFTAVAQMVLSVRIIHVKTNWKAIFSIGIYVVICLSLAWASTYLNMDWKYKILALVLVFMALSFVMKLFNIKELVELVKKREIA